MLKRLWLLRRVFTVSAVALLVAACEATQLYIVHDTVLGLDAGINQARPSGRLAIGYDRYFLSLVPRSVDAAANSAAGTTESAKEAMAALSCSNLKIEGIFLTEFTERLATGRAARNFAKSLKNDADQAGDFFDCFTD